MKNWMKVGMVTSLLLSNSSFAQEKNEKRENTPEQRSEMMTEKMNKELALNEDQKSKVKTINLEAAKAREALKTNKALRPEERRAQVKAIEDKRISNIKAVLTAEQNVKFDKLVEEKKEKIEEKREEKKQEAKEEHEPKTPEERSKHFTDKMTKELLLNADQQQKISTINLQAAKDHEALKNNKTIKEEDRKMEFKKIEEKRFAAIKPLLNAEQLKKFETMIQEKKEKIIEKKENKNQDKVAE